MAAHTRAIKDAMDYQYKGSWPCEIEPSRVNACINACAGQADPAEHRRKVDAVIGASRNLLARLGEMGTNRSRNSLRSALTALDGCEG